MVRAYDYPPPSATPASSYGPPTTPFTPAAANITTADASTLPPSDTSHVLHQWFYGCSRSSLAINLEDRTRRVLWGEVVVTPDRFATHVLPLLRIGHTQCMFF